MYGIWCFEGENSGHWLQEPCNVANPAVLGYISKRKAMKRAAENFGFTTYTEANRKGWCEVRPLPKEN